jgi:transcriptional regulator with XRE-family HTH domain
MTQRELADLVGVIAHHQVSQHERSAAVPSLLSALSYQAIFGVSIIELFPGAYKAIRVTIEGRLERIEKALQDSTVQGRAAEAIARKLEWLSERKNPSEIDSWSHEP